METIPLERMVPKYHRSVPGNPSLNRYQLYEREKRLIRALHLPPCEYQRKIYNLAKRLGA